MTMAWKAAVNLRLREMGWTKKDLGDKIGITKSAVSQMLGDTVASSAHVPAVCDVLSINMPVLGESDELHDLIERTSPEDRLAVLTLARRLVH